MRKKIRNLMAAVALLLAGNAQLAQASHFQGSEMTYICTAPGVYQVNLKLYRDCTGASAPATASLNIKSSGCNPGRNITMTRLGNPVMGNPYCPQITPSCLGGPSTYPNYEEVIFSTTVTFSTAEMACPDWILSWTECCRPGSATLANAAGYSLYTEAYLNLGTPSNPIHNDSPVFGTLVVPFVNAYMPITLSAYAIDSNDDQLVYTLETPLDNPTSAVPYNSYGALVINDPDSNSTKTANAPAGTFSATFPMHSFNVDWTQANPVATPYFDLNAQNGSLSFTPTAYFPNTPAVQGLNKYVTVVKVDEYRNINGQQVKIGSIRRDMFITVMDCGPNTNPQVAAPTANNQPISPNDIISLRPGTPLTFTMQADDNNANDVLHMESDATTMLPGSNFSVTPGNRPTGTLTWTPTAGDVRNQVYYFRVTVKDNACPVKGVQVQTFGVRVSNTGGVTGTKDNVMANAGFSVFPNPFDNEVFFRIDEQAQAESIIIYNILGRQVDQISVSHAGAGNKSIRWERANKYAAGAYVAKLISADKTVQTLKFTKLQ